MVRWHCVLNGRRRVADYLGAGLVTDLGARGPWHLVRPTDCVSVRIDCFALSVR